MTKQKFEITDPTGKVFDFTNFEDVTKFMGGVIKETYGVNPYEKMEFTQLGEDDVVGVGDEPINTNDEKEKLPMPEDDEIDDMARSASEEYQIAHG